MDKTKKNKDPEPLARSAPVEARRTDEPKQLVIENWRDLKAHPAADILPMMSDDELKALGRDIKEHGQLQAIVVVEEGGLWLVLDGRNRLEACRREGVEPRFQRWDGKGSPVEYVFSANLHRRQLDTSQRALAAARAYVLLREERKSAPDRRARGKTRNWVSATFGISSRQVDAAVGVLEDGASELVRAVEHRDVKINAAVAIADLPPEQQREIMMRALEKESGPARKKFLTDQANKVRTDAGAKLGASRPRAWVEDKVRRVMKELKELVGSVEPALLEQSIRSVERLVEQGSKSPSAKAEASP